MKAENNAGIVCSVLSAVLFGLTPLLAKNIYSYGYTSFMLAFARFVLGAVYLFVIIKARRKYKILLPKEQLIKIFIVAIFYALMIILMYSAYNYIDSGLTTTLHFSYPVFVILIVAVLMKRRLNFRQALCTALAVAGIVFLNNSTSYVNYLGVALAVLSGLSYAFYIVLTEKLGMDKIPELVLSFWISVYSSVIVGIMLIFTPKSEINPDAAGIFLLCLIALTTNVFAIVLFQKGLSICGGVTASLLSTFEPLTSVIVGVIVFGEKMTVNVIIGIILILSSTVILVLRK